MLKLKSILTIILVLLLSPLAAQERTDTVYTFRFVPGRDMFYVPWQGNDRELARLEACVDRFWERIITGEIPLLVDGWCNSKADEAANLAVARVRSNRVKSELITRQGLTEKCFITRNHAGKGDYVTVRIAVPVYNKEKEAPTKVQADTVTVTDTGQPEVAAGAESTAEETQTPPPVMEETPPSAPVRFSGWYAGIQGGVPFGVSAYSSFGADKTRAGWSAGVYGGYRFNPVLSIEVQAAWGQTDLSSRGCCPGYWLGNDGALYESAVAGMEGWDWNSLTSRAAMQRYGVQANINLLGFFRHTRESRWRLEVSPLLAVYGTKAEFRTPGGGKPVYEGGTRWHFGAGGSVQAGYDLTGQLHVGVYTGITWLSGQPLDGTPGHLHKANYIWESGLKIGWRFGKQGKEADK